MWSGLTATKAAGNTQKEKQLPQKTQQVAELAAQELKLNSMY